MAQLTKDQLKTKFGGHTKTITVDSWGGEVKIRKLTVAEKNSVDALLYKDMDAKEASKGKVEVTIGKLNESATLAVSFALVDPPMTVRELSELDGDMMAGITAIKSELDPWDKPKKSKEESTSSASPMPSDGQSKNSKKA